MESEARDQRARTTTRGEREREGELSLAIYNGIQKATVGVKDVALWRGPHMAALKVVAVAAPKAIKADNKEDEERVVVGRLIWGGDVARGGRRLFFDCASPGATCVEGVGKSEVDAVFVDAVPAPTCATGVEKSEVDADGCGASTNVCGGRGEV